MSEASIILDEGAQENGLAAMLADLMRQNLEQKPEKAKAFAWLKGSVAITARDAEVSLTLFFNRGSCVIFDGVVGQPDLHVEANSDVILNLSNAPLRFGLPDPLSEESKDLVKKLLSREVVIHGLAFHPLTLILFTNVLSVA